MTPRTEAGRALLGRETGDLDNADPREEWVGDRWAWLSGLREDIEAIEREAVEAYAARLREAVAKVPMFQEDFVVHPMNGKARNPITPADWVEAYRAAVLDLIEREKP